MGRFVPLRVENAAKMRFSMGMKNNHLHEYCATSGWFLPPPNEHAHEELPEQGRKQQIANFYIEIVCLRKTFFCHFFDKKETGTNFGAREGYCTTNN